MLSAKPSKRVKKTKQLEIILMKQMQILAQKGKARAGTLNTAHGKIETPFFMPVATKGSVKTLSHEEVLETGTQCLISNAFILSLKPGMEVIEKFNGMHNFMNWKKGLFTDSGGFQVLSDEFCLKLDEEGVTFRNPYTGKKMMFSPETSIAIQNSLGSDVAMCLDDVPKAGASKERVFESMQRTFEWAQRCKSAHKNKKQLLFGICQGGIYKEFRKKSIEQINSIDFDGVALGGLAIGEPLSKMFETIDYSIPFLPEEKTRYLMGVGSVKEIVKSVARGIDCFDSAFPTRTARHGKAYTSKGDININSATFKFDKKPLDEKCDCMVCKNYSKSYIHHLFRTREENSQKWLTFHNLYFLQNLMKQMREDIISGKFSEKKYLKS
ncbi:MAG TPA: tRNA guanosine(34) transglycosylase Tgt [archaeon]|nr:tRNA guanosine(34) transglycosylase Tgt [archaeon]